MALKPQAVTAPDKITYTNAVKFLAAFSAIGIPVEGLSEEVAINGELIYIPVTDTTMWQDDGNPGIYYAKIWGKFVDVTRTANLMHDDTLSPFNRLIKVASISFVTDSPALTQSLVLAAIDGLSKITDAINAIVLPLTA